MSIHENNDSENGKSYHNDNGKFTSGNPGKPKGASKNKMRDEIKHFIGDRWKDFPEWFDALKPREKIETLLALLPYAVSRLQSVSITDDQGNQPEEPAHDLTKWSEDDLKQLIHLQTKYSYGTRR